MNRDYVNESFLFLSLLECGINSFSILKKRMFFIKSKNISLLVFNLQKSGVIRIVKDGVYLSSNMYLAIRYIDSLDNDFFNRDIFKKKELLIKQLEAKYKKSFVNEVECLIQYV